MSYSTREMWLATLEARRSAGKPGPGVQRATPQRRGDLVRSLCAFGALRAPVERSASCCWARCAATRAS